MEDQTVLFDRTSARGVPDGGSGVSKTEADKRLAHPETTTGSPDPSFLNVVRATARRLQPRRPVSNENRAQLCLSLLKPDAGPPALAEFKELIDGLPVGERHYWIGTLYTLLLPPKARRDQAAYFTPPYLAEAVLDLAIEAGFDVLRHKALDPAAGGAAFLSTIAGRRLALGLPAAKAASGLWGIEIDPGLAEISRGLVADRIGLKVSNGLISVGDALAVRPRACYDLVIANPPYGRISPSDIPNRQWINVAHSGHVNKYAVFADLSLRFAKNGGVVALVLPSSFRAGPLYDRLRSYIRSQGEVLAIGTVASRDGIFADVAQDVSVIVVRKGDPHPSSGLVSFPSLEIAATSTALRRPLPTDPKLPWPMPSAGDDRVGGSCLADYGIEVRAGYFVWNREGERLVTRASCKSFPLIWAKNVKVGALCCPAGKDGKRADFVTFESESQAIVRTPAAVLQRTTNDKQPRRLVAAVVNPKVVRKWGGFVTENHTIVLRTQTLAKLKLAVALLNTKAVDDRYRRVSGTAAVSVTLLRSLDLPSPERFKTALERAGGDAESAAVTAYAESGGGVSR
jgi:adenine-specific DNA-methyltransferase